MRSGNGRVQSIDDTMRSGDGRLRRGDARMRSGDGRMRCGDGRMRSGDGRMRSRNAASHPTIADFSAVRLAAISLIRHRARSTFTIQLPKVHNISDYCRAMYQSMKSYSSHLLVQEACVCLTIAIEPVTDGCDSSIVSWRPKHSQWTLPLGSVVFHDINN